MKSGDANLARDGFSYGIDILISVHLGVLHQEVVVHRFGFEGVNPALEPYGPGSEQGIVPDVGLPQILRGTIPFVLLMLLSIILLCVFPEIATWLPERLMGVSG